jgi:hypothetical protein
MSTPLDIINLFPMKKRVGTNPLYDPEIKYEATAPEAQGIMFPRYRRSHLVSDENPKTNGVPLHLGRPYDTQQFYAPISEGNKLGTPEQILQATYLQQLQPTDVNMATRVNESGAYPYFMNEFRRLEGMIRQKETTPVAEPVVEAIPEMVVEQQEMESEMEELEEMVKKPKRGGARKGAGAKPKYNVEEILNKLPTTRTAGEKSFLRRYKRKTN